MELNEDLGLNWLDYGARWYDPAIARFPSVDPIIEKFPHLTPYNYASNDPISKIDLWGLQGWPVNELLGRWENMASPVTETLQKRRVSKETQQRVDLFRTGSGNLALGVGGTIAGAGIAIGSEGFGAGLGGSIMVLSLTEASIGMSQMADAVFGEGDPNSVLQKSTSGPGLVAYAAGFENAALIDVAGEVLPALMSGGLSAASGIDDLIDAGKKFKAGNIFSASFKLFQADDAFGDSNGLVEEVIKIINTGAENGPTPSTQTTDPKQINDIMNFINQLPGGNQE